MGKYKEKLGLPLIVSVVGTLLSRTIFEFAVKPYLENVTSASFILHLLAVLIGALIFPIVAVIKNASEEFNIKEYFNEIDREQIRLITAEMHDLRRQRSEYSMKMRDSNREIGIINGRLADLQQELQTIEQRIRDREPV